MSTEFSVRCNGPCNKVKPCKPYPVSKMYCHRCAVRKGLLVDESVSQPATNTTVSNK
ncbi:unnamed protein product [Penicillium camemberti]|uniref:Str. FM013 n=1 Tax=Penicillium camemberti (strain FM 013) TaxID=1429867 RepID=A0A0G4P5T7_PENC3|nr:unnamed protein product [Penicillium camemberti]